MYAKLELIGNLTADPAVQKVNTSKGEKTVTKFSIAVNNPFKRDEPASFFNDIAAWNGLGENIARYCNKGSKVFVSCDVKVVRSEKDGSTRTFHNYEVREVRFLSNGNGREATAEATDELVEATLAPIQPAEDQMEVPF